VAQTLTPFCEGTIMQIEYSITVRVAYCVEIEGRTPAEEDDRVFNNVIDWLETLERLERFAESYGNEDGHVCTIPSLFALAAQAVTTDNEELQAALPSATKEGVEQIREIYPILVKFNSLRSCMDEEENFRDFLRQTDRFKTITSKVLGKICGHDDHGLEFGCIGHANDASDVEAKLFLVHGIPFQTSCEVVEVNVVPLSLSPVGPTVGVSMEHVLSVLGMKHVDEPGWKVITHHYEVIK
jgi:hypothetical protein